MQGGHIMKIRVLSILLVLLLLLTACQSANGHERKMLEDFRNQYYKNSKITVDQLSFLSYGTYDGCFVGYIFGPFGTTAAHSYERVGTFTFRYPSGQHMQAYKNGTWMSMADAYDNGWLDDDAVEQILQKHKQKYAYMYSEYSD